MRLIRPYYKIITDIDENDIYKKLELYGRNCYKSEDRITEDSAPKFCKIILNRNHESVIEHISLTVKFVVDRGFLAEITRHRLASFSVESTRYINYDKKEMEFIIPLWFPTIKEGVYKCPDELLYEDIDGKLVQNIDVAVSLWLFTCFDAEKRYNDLILLEQTPEQARSILPHSLKTEIIVTANLREWRHIFKLRCDKASHPQMREIMIPLRNELAERLPVIFNKY